MKKSYKIAVDCASCANKMELVARKVAGVEAVAVNFITQKITVSFAEGADIPWVMAQVQKVCRKIDSDCMIEL